MTCNKPVIVDMPRVVQTPTGLHRTIPAVTEPCRLPRYHSGACAVGQVRR